MATQLKINTGSPISLKEMSAAEIDYSVHQILTAFAATDTGIGSIQVNPGSTTGLTLIGTFTDTYLNATPGQHPIGTTPVSTTYNFYQNLGSTSESLTRPIEYNSGIKEQTDTNLNAGVISRALANLVATGIGSYQLSPTAPTGGTWASKATLTNYLDSTTTNVTYLWKKTAAASTPSTVRPLKINTGSPISLKEMSDSEIQSLAARLNNQLVSTGIGTCAVQAAAPTSGGTWVSEGIGFVDTTRTASTQSYTGSYAGSYTGSYTGSYSGSVTKYFTGYYSGSYTGTYAGSYTGAYTIYYAGRRQGPTTNHTYTGFYSGSYTGTYTGTYAGSYLRPYTGSYTGSYAGSYSGSYSGITLNNDTSTVSTVYLWVRTA